MLQSIFCQILSITVNLLGIKYLDQTGELCVCVTQGL